MRVLVAIDGSEPASVAVDLVARMAWPPDTTIVVAEAAPQGTEIFGGPWPAIALTQADQIEAGIREEAQQTVDDAARRLEAAGLQASAVVRTGRPATEMVDLARAMQADLIVVGSVGHGTIETMLLGSVSSEIVDRSPVPVLVARGPRIERVILAWDGSVYATRAAELVQTWPVFAASAIRVVSVADLDVPWQVGFLKPSSPELSATYVEIRNASREQFDTLAGEMVGVLRSAGLDAEPDRREGAVAPQILEAARSWDADLIVMGSRGRTGLTRLVLGSAARNVVQHAVCSVLIVHDGTAASRSPSASAPTDRPVVASRS